MWVVHVRGRHFNDRQSSVNILTAGCVFFWGVTYAWDKNTSVRHCANNAGGDVFAGHYGTFTHTTHVFLSEGVWYPQDHKVHVCLHSPSSQQSYLERVLLCHLSSLSTNPPLLPLLPPLPVRGEKWMVKSKGVKSGWRGVRGCKVDGEE